MLKIFDRYLGNRVLFTTVFAVVVLSVVLVLGNIFKKLISELEKYPDLGWGFVIEFVLNVLPFSFIFTIPWGFLTAILLIYGRLSADNELTALRMAGWSMPRICMPIFVVGALATAATLWMNVEVAPRSQAKIQQIFFKAATENPGAMFVNDEVINTLPGYLIYTQQREQIEGRPGHYKLENLQLVKLTSRHRPDVFIQANRGEIGFEGGNLDDLVMDLKDAHIENSISVDAQDFREHQIIRAADAPLHLSLAELKEKHRKLRPSYLTVPELREEIANEENPVRKSSLKTEFHKRLSLSLACVTFCLIGIPLGVTAQRRETSIGFVLSLIVGISYFMFIVIAEMFHQKPHMKPHLLMWTPNLIFLTLGLFLFARLCRR